METAGYFRRGHGRTLWLFDDIGKGKGSGFILRHFVSISPSVRSGMDHTVLSANYTIPASTS